MQEFNMNIHRAERLNAHVCSSGEVKNIALTFDAELKNWSSRIFAGAGVWSCCEGDCEPYIAYRKQSLGLDRASASQIIYGPLTFHKIELVKVNMRALTDRVSAGVIFGWQFGGHYHVRFDRLPGKWAHLGIYKTKPRVIAFYDTLAVCDFDGFEVGKFSELEVVTREEAGMVTISAFVDGRLILTAADEKPSGFLCGAVGCRVAEGEADFSSFSVAGVPEKSNPVPSLECEFDSYEYQYDYADRSYPVHEGTSLPAHFVYSREQKGVKQRGKALHVKADGYVPLKFHTLSKNAEIKAVIKGDGGKFGFVARNFIPDGYIKAGLDTANNKWYIEDVTCPDTRAFFTADNEFSGDEYLLALSLNDAAVTLFVNGKSILTATVKNTYHGNLGLFAENSKLSIVSVNIKTDAPVTENITMYSLFPNLYSHYGQILESDEKTMLAIFGKNALVSRDKGLTFDEDKKNKYKDINSAGGYASLIRRRDGKLIQILSDTCLTVQQSDDGAKWETIGRVVPEKDCYDEDGNKLCGHHVDSIREIMLSGGPRLFMPVVFRVYGAKKVFSDEYQLNGHFTRVYYSDDGGKTWTASENDTRDCISNSYTGSGCSFTESKVLKCPDGVLRLFVTRFDNNSVHYIESHNNGRSWEGLYALDGMVCGRTSHGSREDPYNRGNYYLVYVKDEPYTIGSLFPRTQLILAHSTDGVNWREVMLLDRLPHVAVPTSYDLYQFLDPSIFIGRDYIYIAYGKSVGEGEAYHNAQRTHYIRLKRPDLDNMDMPYKALHKSKKVE